MDEDCVASTSRITHERCDSVSPPSDDSDSSKPKPKRLKLFEDNDSLEDRIHGVLCCAVCLDLPNSAVYQCRNGHLMCYQCFHHLLADAQLKLTSAICPSCRTLISRDLCVRNLVVEKAVQELTITCPDCSMKFPRFASESHEKQICLERHSFCIYKRIGCPWEGPYKKKHDHEKKCAQPQKDASEIIQAVPNSLLDLLRISEGYIDTVWEHLSFEKISYNDLQLLGPYQTDDYFIRFETFRFCAFGMEWEIRAHVNNNEIDPTQSCERTLRYQLVLFESVDKSIMMHYTIVNGPLGEMKLKPKIEKFKFSEETPESHYALLPLEDQVECYRLLSGTIRFRLIMFWNDSAMEMDS